MRNIREPVLSTLFVLAELDKKIVVKWEYCPQGFWVFWILQWGTVVFRLCKDGEWKTVLVDDLLPCDRRRQLVYSQV